MLAPADPDGDRPAEGRRLANLGSLAEEEPELGQVAQQVGAAVGDAPDRRPSPGSRSASVRSSVTAEAAGPARGSGRRAGRESDERLVDPRLELLGKRVLEPVGLP